MVQTQIAKSLKDLGKPESKGSFLEGKATPQVLASFSIEDMEFYETGLFWKALPDRGFG